MDGRSEVALAHLERAVEAVGFRKSERLLEIIDRINSKEKATLEEVVLLYKDLYFEFAALCRPHLGPLIAGHLISYLEDNELRLVEAALDWRERRLSARESAAAAAGRKLRMAWHNFLETVVLEPDLGLSRADKAGYWAEPAATPRLAQRVAQIKERREVAEQLQRLLRTEWGVEKAHGTDLVASSYEVQQKLAGPVEALFAQREEAHLVSVDRGVQATPYENQFLLSRRVHELVVKRTLRARHGESSTGTGTEELGGVVAFNVLIALVRELWRNPQYREMKTAAQLLRSLAGLRCVLDVLFVHYAGSDGGPVGGGGGPRGGGPGEDGALAVGKHGFWRFVDQVQLPCAFACRKGAELLHHLFLKFATRTGRSERGARKGVTLPLWYRFLDELAWLVAMVTLVGSQPEFRKQAGQKKIKLSLSYSLPDRRNSLFFFTNNYLLALYTRLLAQEAPLRRYVKRRGILAAAKTDEDLELGSEAPPPEDGALDFAKIAKSVRWE
ncbi:hypothetical protein GNI_164100 [Gregarina niphandrodes]|uniref:Uncharacterized protein n=1 Tax=Gregarina niphandrodes TaxID=110365 RepID=A0A023AZ81_GRENI|nr:hypothetical protein GNI_164100 [Gregarina niphandrodes]EZG43630.1 hypothetical protein GNI_164100 [Gregarina niphandrodes]|eukprot:XP_011133133.1 hypothetical protein GNI_164100 [Gregarina niphandrodes]